MARIALGAAAICAVWALPVMAAPAQSYDIAAQEMGPALEAFAAVSGREVLAPSDVIAGKRANAVRGDLTPEEALARLIDGTGLRYEVVEGAFVIKPIAATGGGSSIGDTAGIVVTGSRIRGAAIASPHIVLGAESFKDQGLATLTEVARTIPQNFGGGQNPGVGINVPTASGVNVSNGSSLNLRGLGSDATLTLLNGRRLSYSGSRQSVDLSSIPTAIVDRIEIVADGASAIYGSDAVAGVANIILRRDAEGVVTTALIGGSTDGGNDQRIVGVTAGTRWNDGGGILAYEYGTSSPIVGSQRSYTGASAARGLDLLPDIARHNAAASVHQDLGRVSLSLDALYNRRRGLTVYAANATGDRNGVRVESSSRNESVLVAPSLGVDLGAGWRAGLSASYAKDTGRYASNIFNGATLVSPFNGCYCNTFWSTEATADGPLIALPGGPVRLALGAGARDVAFVSIRGTNSVQNIDEHQRSVYAFGEANIPALARGDGSPLLQASAALRFERYPKLADVVTPKLGLVLSPTPDFDLKASWGRSFRAATMLQRFESTLGILLGAASVGGTGLPAGSTALLVSGGRPDLKPEKARSWSLTADLHPHMLEGARLEVSYFTVRYADRIVIPIAFTSQSLSNPLYADQVTRAPAPAAVTATDGALDQFFNISGVAYDPARVVAIIDNASVNAAVQRVQGIDAAFTYEQSPGTGAGRINAALYASYLDSSQRLTAAQPEFPLAGRLFNPPHFRARGVLGWRAGIIALTGAVNRIGGVTDARKTTPVAVRGMTTFDLTARLRSAETSGLTKGLEFTLTVQNLLNTAPDRIATSQVYDNPYDSTNYSPMGRYIALSVSKSW
jgi:outer membrane receptor protein involved in Fe transport